MGDFNQMVVLDQVRRAPGGSSRVELAGATGLSLQAISNIVGRLIALGLVVEGERRAEGRGKPRTMLHLNPRGAYALGVHVDPVVVTSVLVDLSGDAVAKTVVDTPTGPEAVVAAVAAATRGLLERAGVDREAVLGLGVAAPGPVDFASGAVVHPPLLAGWERVPIRSMVAEATGFDVVLEKDVSAAMVAELWRGERMLRGTSVFFYTGFGVAAAVAVDGELVRGSSRNAGEIGHLIVDADGPPCACGSRGCIGASAAAQTLVDEAVARGVLAPGTPAASPRELDAALTAVAEAASDGDAVAGEILTVSARRVARGITTVADLLDAQVVVFGGPAWSRLAPHYLPVVRAELAAHATLRELHAVEVLGSALGDHVGALGAASLVLDGLFTPRPSDLVVRRAAPAGRG
ncbi:ROK family transcriptional regulator [Puerhibacterium puerhi]|uniref:ROK family transcriptional regulator n=1 Tax=Puerhibacterium puerhi TaxID=2692623 RepID=UPI001F3E1ECB|nr:ROK family transcriptional regulator [Puerhibacterium puerhi]